MRYIVATAIVMALVGCNGKGPTSPSTTQPKMHIELSRISGSTVELQIWGEIVLGLERAIPAGDSINSGGLLVVKEQSCGQLRTYMTGTSNALPRDDTDRTRLMFELCGSQVDMQVWFQTYKGERIQHTLDYTDIRPATLRKQGRRVVGTLP